MDKKSGVVAFAFGAPCNITSNMFIAFIAIDKAIDLKAPIYTQNDVSIKHKFINGVEYIEGKKGKPPSTLRIARGAVTWAKKLGLDELWIAAAEPHLWRCARDLKAAVREAGMKIDIKCCEKNDLVLAQWFCPDSTQARTRSPKKWERRERIIRILPFLIYKIICG